MRIRSTCFLATALALGACSRDVTLPPRPTAPEITDVRPAAAWAGQRIEIVASGLDAVAEGNLVQFASGAVARGESASGDTLVVRVPAGAGTGAIALQATGGASAPWGPFTYRGLGQLRAGAISGEVPLLHKPYRILAVAGDTFLHSDLLLGVVRYQDPSFVADLAVSVDALPWAGSSGAVVWLESDFDAGGSRLVRLELAGGIPVDGPPVTYAGVGPIVAMRAPDRIAVLRDPGSAPTVALHDAATLAQVQAPALLPGVVEVRGCADAGAGQLACLVRTAWGGPLSLALVTPGAAPVPIPLPGGDTIHEDPVDRGDPICAASPRAGVRFAAVALEDGRVAVARLDGTPAWARDVDTGSRTPARSLACATIATRLAVLAPKRADDLVVAVDAEAGSSGDVLWSASVPRASRAAVDAAAGTVHAAGEADNRVLVLDAASGALLARRSFDVLPGRDGALQAAAWMTAGDGSPAELVFVTGSPPGVIELPLVAAPDTFPVYRARPDAVGVFGSFAPYDPGYRWYYTLRAEGVSQSSQVWDLGAPAHLGQDGPLDAYVATVDGLATLEWDGGWTGAWSLSPIANATFASIGLLPGDPDDRVFAAVMDGAFAWTVRAWSQEAAAAGGGAERTWSSPGFLVGAALLDDVLWAFHWDGDVFTGTQLDPATLDPIGAVPLAEPFGRILAVSPNGRTFVTWEYQPYSWETSVVVWSGGAIGWERAATVPVQGVVSGVAFDGSGEALYVLTRSPDRVVVLE